MRQGNPASELAAVTAVSLAVRMGVEPFPTLVGQFQTFVIQPADIPFLKQNLHRRSKPGEGVCAGFIQEELAAFVNCAFGGGPVQTSLIML